MWGGEKKWDDEEELLFTSIRTSFQVFTIYNMCPASWNLGVLLHLSHPTSVFFQLISQLLLLHNDCPKSQWCKITKTSLCFIFCWTEFIKGSVVMVYLCPTMLNNLSLKIWMPETGTIWSRRFTSQIPFSQILSLRLDQLEV